MNKASERTYNSHPPRFCPHGNLKRMKGTIRNDGVAARFDVTRLMLLVATILGLIIGCSDIKKAFLQSGPIKRELQVRFLRDLGLGSSIFWLLAKLLYGIFEAGDSGQKHLNSGCWSRLGWNG